MIVLVILMKNHLQYMDKILSYPRQALENYEDGMFFGCIALDKYSFCFISELNE